MNAKDKFNRIIETIEQSIESAEYISDIELADKAFKAGQSGYMDPRLQRNVFDFMVNMSVADYIARRRMMKAWEYYLLDDTSSRDKAYSVAMVSTQKGFIGKFRKVFGCTPEDAKKHREKIIIEEPFYWDNISKEKQEKFVEDVEAGNMINQKFGVPLSVLDVAIKAKAMQEFYGLTDDESDLAYELATRIGQPLEKTFEYVYNFAWPYLESDSSNIKDADQKMLIVLNYPIVIKLYFDYGMSFDEVDTLVCLKSWGLISEKLDDLSVEKCKDYIKNGFPKFEIEEDYEENEYIFSNRDRLYEEEYYVPSVDVDPFEYGYDDYEYEQEAYYLAEPDDSEIYAYQEEMEWMYEDYYESHAVDDECEIIQKFVENRVPKKNDGKKSRSYYKFLSESTTDTILENLKLIEARDNSNTY